MKLLLKCCGAWLFLLALGCNTDYQDGYREGVQDVRELRKEAGIVGEIGLQIMDDLGTVPVDEQKSADWNAGYREGVRRETKK
jgi:hypothetical protein